MRHRLVDQIVAAFKWVGSGEIGRDFVWGRFDDSEVCTGLLTVHRMLELIMRRSLSPHLFRCLVNGDDIHPQRYIKMAAGRRGYSVPIADMERIGDLLKVGCTLILDQANVYDPSLEVACRALQWWSNESVQVNLYLTTGTASGFDLHWDDHDVIVVQLAGDKTWQVRGTSRPAPMFRDAVPNYEPSEDVVWNGVLRKGEAIHIPRGYWHQATRNDRGDGFSLHASFGFHKRTGVDWMAWLADQSRHDELFRHDLERSGGEAAQRMREAGLCHAAAELIANKPFAEYLATRARHQPSGRHIVTHGIFGQPSMVVCVTGFAPQIEKGDSTITLAAAGRRIIIDKVVWPALEMLIAGNPVNLDDVEKQTGINPRPVASALLREGICAEVTPELLSGYLSLAS